MRVLFVVTRYPCVTETFIVQQLAGLRALGHEVYLLADSEDSAISTTSGQVEINLTYTAVPTNYLYRCLKVALFLLIHWRQSVQLGRVIRPNLRLFYAAVATLKLPAFDIIHAHFGPNGVQAERLRQYGFLAGPLVTTFYGYDVSRLIQEHNPYKQLFTRGDRFLALSKTMQQQLLVLGCNPTKLFIHPLGIPLAQFVPTQSKKHDPATLHLLSVARLVPKKGIEYAIRAIAQLLDAKELTIRIRYTIVGDGLLFATLQQLVVELDLVTIITFVGWQTQAEVVEWMNSADIFLAPSIVSPLGDQEGTPRSILEAMAMQLPIIATTHSGIPDIMPNHSCGILIPERNTVFLVEAIRQLIYDPPLRKSMGQRGRKIIEQNHNSGNLCYQLVEQYSQAKQTNV